MKARFFYVFWILIGLSILCLLYGFFIEPRRLILREVKIESESYQGEPIKIVFISDIHIGGGPITTDYVDRLVRRINAVSPDIVLIGGDYIDGHLPRPERSRDFNDSIETSLKTLQGLSARQGIYSVTGNHDNWYDGKWVTETLSRYDVQVLENRAVNLETICIVGLADFDTATPLPSAYHGCDEGKPPILLTHSPDAFRYLRSDTILALAGHTHGGQINLPLIGRRVTATRAGKALAYGLKEIGGIPAYITSGIGTSILPARFRAPPEIVILTLVQANP
jgi:predicted MPP superfamily phosphohydrolase